VGGNAASKYGVKKVPDELYEFLSLAAQTRAKNVIDQLVTISQQRLDLYKVRSTLD